MITLAIKSGRHGGAYIIQDNEAPLPLIYNNDDTHDDNINDYSISNINNEDIENTISQSSHSSTTVRLCLPPAFFLPSLSTNDRKIMRPDIFVALGLPSQEHNLPDNINGFTSETTQNAHIHVLEIKYCNEAFHDQSSKRAHAQHEKLITHLKMAGWKYVHFHFIPLGYFGAIPTNLATCLTTLGVLPRSAAYLQNQMHFHAIISSSNIITKYHRDTAENATNSRSSEPP